MEQKQQLQQEQKQQQCIETRISQVIGWRDVPFDNSMIGDTAKGTEPHVVQVFVENSDGKPNWDFERELYRVRKVGDKQWHTAHTRTYQYNT